MVNVQFASYLSAKDIVQKAFFAVFCSFASPSLNFPQVTNDWLTAFAVIIIQVNMKKSLFKNN